MRAILLFIFSIFGSAVFAQTFTELMNTPFEGVRQSAIAFVDVDGDNDQDVIMTGQDNSSTAIKVTSLYINNGLGEYTKDFFTLFEGTSSGCISFADVDMDGDQDVLISGLNNSNISIAKLYLNDGQGSFTESMDTSFEGVHTSSSDFKDVDGDGDQDFFIAGINNAGSGIAKLYTNDGFGNFTEVAGTPFLGVVDSSIAFADVDGDNDYDLLITGMNSPAPSPGPLANLYLNDGAGNFSQMFSTPFEPCIAGSISFADIDGDNDQDVLITGINTNFNPAIYISKLYTNDGLGNYSEVIDTPFEPVVIGSVAFADIDGDNDQDVLITGNNKDDNDPLSRVSILYTNDGSGTFTEVLNTPFEEVSFGAIAFNDVDGDDDQDLMITGWTKATQGVPAISIAKLYLNESTTSFWEKDLNRVEFNLHPNPVVGQDLKISFTSNEKKHLTISLLDLNGRTLKQFSEQISAGENNYPLDVSSIPNGSYFIKLDDGKTNGVQKIIIQ